MDWMWASQGSNLGPADLRVVDPSAALARQRRSTLLRTSGSGRRGMPPCARDATKRCGYARIPGGRMGNMARGAGSFLSDHPKFERGGTAILAAAGWRKFSPASV